MKVTRRSPVFSTKWFALTEKRVDYSDEPFYSIATLDYVTTVAVTCDDEMLFVRQYRPAVEAFTLEFPSGHVDAGEQPEQSARRELFEETGYHAPAMELVGSMAPDTGRLENRMWCFYANGVRPTDRQPESGLEVVKVPLARVRDLIANGELQHALNVAALMFTLTRTNSLRIF